MVLWNLIGIISFICLVPIQLFSAWVPFRCVGLQEFVPDVSLQKRETGYPESSMEMHKNIYVYKFFPPQFLQLLVFKRLICALCKTHSSCRKSRRELRPRGPFSQVHWCISCTYSWITVMCYTVHEVVLEDHLETIADPECSGKSGCVMLRSTPPLCELHGLPVGYQI